MYPSGSELATWTCIVHNAEIITSVAFFITVLKKFLFLFLLSKLHWQLLFADSQWDICVGGHEWRINRRRRREWIGRVILKIMALIIITKDQVLINYCTGCLIVPSSEPRHKTKSNWMIAPKKQINWIWIEFISGGHHFFIFSIIKWRATFHSNKKTLTAVGIEATPWWLVMTRPIFHVGIVQKKRLIKHWPLLTFRPLR